MMKKVLVSFFCFLPLLFSVSFAEDNGHGVEVSSASSQLLEVEPGKIVTGSFLIYNRTQREEEFFEKLTLPSGWQEIASEEFPLKLEPEERQLRVVAFLVPVTSPAGRHQISYLVQSRRDLNIADSDTIAVVVLPVTKLQILVEEKPEVVIAGEAYEVRLRLANKGNSKTDLRLKIKPTPDYPLSMKPTEIALEAGKSQIIRLEVKTDEKLRKRIKNILEIKAETEESGNGVASLKQTVLVEIIPKVTGESDRYRRLPTQVAIVGAGQDGKSGLQAEFSGRGSLNEDRTRRIDFLFRGPDIQERSRLGKRDEFRLSYLRGPLALHLGDRGFSLSPLTEKFYYGRGAEVNIHPAKFEIGAFYLESRWEIPKAKKIGTYLGYRFNDRFEIKGNWLSKSKDSTSSFEGYDVEIYSIQTEIDLSEWIRLGLESGLAQGERKGKLSNVAFRIDIDGRISNQIWYAFHKTHAGPEYLGYYNDADYTSGAMTFPIYRKLRGKLSYRSTKSNLDLDSTKETANREKSYQSSISYSFPFGTHISLDYRDLIRGDDALPANYDYREKALRLGVAQTLGKFSLHTHAERGKFEDMLLAITNDNLERYSFYASFRQGHAQTYNLYARIGHSSFTPHPERTKSAGISGSWKIKHNLSFKLNYQRDNAGFETSQQRDNVFSTFTYTFKNRHALVARAQWSRYEQKKEEDFSFLVTYSIPLSIPVGKNKSIGVLKGKVYDGERADRSPISKIILTVDEATALTNQDGEFIFPSLAPGIHYLRVERSSIGLNRITTEKLPMMVEVKGGETVEIEIGVATSCGISGRVAVFASGSDKNLGDQDTSIILGSTAPGPGTEKTFYPELEGPPRSIKLLETKEAISVSSDVSFTMRCFEGSEKREYFSGKGVSLKPSSAGIILSDGEEEKFEEKIERVVFIPQDKSFCFSLNGKDYRGILEVLFVTEDSSLLALDWSPVEDYLKGVVGFEMGSQGVSEFEAHRAQAVAASSESLFLIGPGEEEGFEKDDLRQGRGLANTLVEITEGEEVLRQLTDEKGGFSFEDIRPGEWKLKVYDHDLPIHHSLEQEEFQIDLKPGEEKEVTARVTPRLRPIQIIDQGEIEQENR
jgi:hypothetical protein